MSDHPARYDEVEANRRLVAAERVIAALRCLRTTKRPPDEGVVLIVAMRDCGLTAALAAYDAATAALQGVDNAGSLDRAGSAIDRAHG